MVKFSELIIVVEVTFLGTSGTLPTKERNQVAVHLRHNDNFILWDCGEGTQRQIAHTKTSAFKIDYIYISHLHADHLLGIGGLIQTMQFLGRKKDLVIYGPRGIEEYVKFFIDWDYRERGFKIEIREIFEGVLHEEEDYFIGAFPVKHNCVSYGFIFQEKPGLNLDKDKLKELGLLNNPKCRELKEKGVVSHLGREITVEEVAEPMRRGKKIVYSGDTVACSSLRKASEGADLLIADSAFGEEHRDKSREYMHGTAREMAELAKEAGVKKLVLIHFSNRYRDESLLEDEAREVFENSFAAKDLMKIEV